MKKPSIALHILVLILAALSVHSPVRAQETTAITYQGQLIENGKLATGLYDLQFSLWRQAIGSDPADRIAAPITLTNVSIAKGGFSASLDFGDVYTNQSLWLELSVRPAGTTVFADPPLAPRQRLTASPFALHTLHADRAREAERLASTYPYPLSLTNTANVFQGTFVGDGSRLVNLPAVPIEIPNGSITSDKLASDSVTATAVNDGELLPAHLDLTRFGTTFWQVGGNGITDPTTQFIGTSNDQPLEMHVNGRRALRLEPDSLGGVVVIGGAGNVIDADTVGAVIAGGGGAVPNRILNQSHNSVISGGTGNEVNANNGYGTIGGGANNVVRGLRSTIGGGELNAIDGGWGTVSGGYSNTVAGGGSFHTIGGGEANHIGTGGGHSTIAGGAANSIADNATFATIGGGQNNTIGSQPRATTFATIPGGEGNSAQGHYSFAAGRGALADHDGAFVWADDQGPNENFPSVVDNEFAVRASGGVRLETFGGGATLDGLPLLAGTIGGASIANDAVTTAKIDAGAVDNSKLANSTITVTTDNGLLGGAVVSLGGTLGLSTTATPANTPSTLVARNGSGDFAAGSISLAGSLNLPATTSATSGVIISGGIPALSYYGGTSTFVGHGSGNFTMTGGNNTAVGLNSFATNTTGINNSAFGVNALSSNTTGNFNTALGEGALYGNTSGAQNVAVGRAALFSNTTADNNTGLGDQALYENTTGVQNVAVGRAALFSNTTANDNIGVGEQALYQNTAGANNVALGRLALWSSTGNGNIGIGASAGANLTTGDNNIAIGHAGFPGESGTIRIGTPGVSTDTYIAGISGQTAPAGVAVLVAADGKLGTILSSHRFKEAIRDMEDASAIVTELRPVTFRYKPDLDPTGLTQFGLVAEEVEKVAPELVIHDADGKPLTVRYEAVNAMLLNEFQKQHRKIQEQDQVIRDLRNDLAQLGARLASLDAELQSRTAESGARHRSPLPVVHPPTGLDQ